MYFRKHPELEGVHAFLSPSKGSWVNYDEAKLREAYARREAKIRGTILHDLASRNIDNKIKVANLKRGFNKYINDCIGFGMKTEVKLKYSYNCHGKVDAIGGSEIDKVLRIFDLKTGETPGSWNQLLIYAAIFMLEYDHNPFEWSIQLRIYQYDGFEEYEEGDIHDEVKRRMDIIRAHDKLILEMDDVQ